MMLMRDAKRRAESIARDIATADGNRRLTRLGNDDSHIVFGSAGVDAVVDAIPDDQGERTSYMVRVRFVEHGAETQVGTPILARGRPGDPNVPSDNDVATAASLRLGD